MSVISVEGRNNETTVRMGTLRILSRTGADGKASVSVGTSSPYKVYGSAEVTGTVYWEVLLRRAERIAGRRARRVLAEMLTQNLTQ